MSKQQRLVLLVSILASFVAFLDGSVVNVALPTITKELGGGLAAQQWIVDAYLITLGTLILLAGSLSDIYGRKKIMLAGLLGFAVASVLCSVAPNSSFLIIARGVQGVAGALLVPSSLALIISAFKGAAQSKAIGTWTAWTGMSFLVGPMLGGFLVENYSWRLVFAINLLPIAITVVMMSKLDELNHVRRGVKVDIGGALLCILGLAGTVFGLIEAPRHGWSSTLIYAPLAAGLLFLLGFIRHENRVKNPMLPLSLFKVRNFLYGNLATVVIYAGLSVATFLIVIFVQQVGGYSAFNAGLTLIPVTLLMFVFSPRFGALAGKYGPRLFMTVGPIVGAAGFLIMLGVDEHINYWTELFPALVVFGIGLSMTVSPLTAAVLGAIESERAGIGSAVNNAVARIAGLIGIAGVGVFVGTSLTTDGFHNGVLAMAGLLFLGGVVSFAGIRNPVK